MIGEKDMGLLQRLLKAAVHDHSNSHSKFLRQILVTVDITAPEYWWSEFDTYKVGTVANSTSKMHKGLARPLELENFEIPKEWLENKNADLWEDVDPEIPEEEEVFVDIEGFPNYMVSNRMRIIRKEYSIINVFGQKRTYKQKEIQQTLNSNSYKQVGLLNGVYGQPKTQYVHRIIAKAFVPNDDPEHKTDVNHKDGNKWNNNPSNLEWVTKSENDKHASRMGLKITSGYNRYRVGATARRFSDSEVNQMKEMFEAGFTKKEIAQKFECYDSTVCNILNGKTYKQVELSHKDYFKKHISILNTIRENYLSAEDKNVKEQWWRAWLELLPMSYLQTRTVTLNYQVLRQMVKDRKNHKLTEWSKDFVGWVEQLPYAKELIMYEGD